MYDRVSTASVDARLVPKVRGGRGRGAAALRASGQLSPSQSAVLFKIVLGRETVVIGADAVMALMGVVYCGQGGYLVRRDSCFH